MPRCASSSASRSAASRPSSTCARRCCAAPSRPRWPPPTPPAPQRIPMPTQFSIAAALAASIGIAAAKANVKDCIQVLGGIGCTWEHDAHLYLRRAHSIGRFLGGAERWLRRITALTQVGCAPSPGLSTSPRSRVSEPRSPRPSPRSPRCPRRSGRRPWPRRGCRRRTGRRRTGAARHRPSSC